MGGGFDVEDFKVQLNNFMLMRAPEFMTIGEAETAMLLLVAAVEISVMRYNRSRETCAESVG